MAKVKKVTGTPKADTITVKATSATVNKKKLSVYASGVTVGALAGDDVIKIIGGSQRTVLGGAGKDRITVSSGNGHKKIDGGSGNDTITVSSGKNHKIYGGSGNDTITIGKSAGSGITVYGGAGNDTIKALNKYKVTIYGDAGNDTITGGASSDVLYGGTGNDTIVGGTGNDTLYGGKDADTLTGGKGKDTFVYAKGDGKDTITDYAASNDTLRISSGSISKTALVNSSKDLRFTVGSGTVTLKNAANKTISLKDSRGTYTASKTEIVLESDFKGEMNAAAYLATVTDVEGFAAKNAVTIKGNGNANTLIGGKGDDYLYGLAGDDTLDGGFGNDTLTGGAGKDTFLYTNGDDTITDYTQGEDKLEIEDYVRVSNVAVNGGNVNLAVSLASVYNDPTVTGNIKLQNASGKEIQVTEKYQGTYTLTAGNKTTASLDQDYTGKIFMAANGIDEIDAGFTTENLTVMGNAKDNVIYAGKADSTIYGLAGDDTLYGGAGNDTLTGDDGKDTFVYVGGDDKITDYKQGEDKLEIEDYVRVSNVTVNGENVNLAVSLASVYNDPTVTGNIKLQNASGKEIQVTEKYQGTYTLTAGNKTTATLGQDYTGTIFLAANGIDEIDARATTANLTVMGNKEDNFIYAGESGSKMYGLAGSDTFYFDNTCSGTDTIYDFEDYEVIKFASDMLDHGTAGEDYTIEGNNVLLHYTNNQGGTGTISLINAKGKTATIDINNGRPYEMEFS